MIHRLLLSLDGSLPFYPPAAVGVAVALIIVVALSFYGRSKGTVLFSTAVLLLGAGLAIGLIGLDRPSGSIRWEPVEDLADGIVGPCTFRRWEQLTTAGVALSLILFYSVYTMAFSHKPGERARQELERDEGAALGSARLCGARTFKRWRKHDPSGWTLQGQFWGAKGQTLGTSLSLSGEDIARGVAVFGPQGSGKTQDVILPAIADRMRDGHSLIVTDVQGELQPYIEKIAAVTGHLLVVHNPSDPAGSCAINLCDWVDNVADARSMAAVLLSEAHGQGDPFWARAAVNLLAACALHYPNLGRVLEARKDLYGMAKELAKSETPGAAELAADFTGSMRTQDPKLALNIMAEAFNVGLAPWADPAVRGITGHTDLDLAAQLAALPTVLILRCARRHTEAYGPYLGTILRVLTTRLDDLGERQANGQLPIPVGLILEEFPALGRLDSLVRDINLVRKRRISVLTAAQSLAQFDHVYPGKGEADRLLAGLATKIVLGGCDQRTAEFFSQLSGHQTLTVTSRSESHRRPGGGDSDATTASLRGRSLLLPDDLIRPARGHATVFAAFSQGRHAEQAVFLAELTPFFWRKDWQLSGIRPKAPLTLPKEPHNPPQEPEPEKPEPEEPEPENKESIVSGWHREEKDRER